MKEQGNELPAKLKDLTQQHVSDMVFLQEAREDEVQNTTEAKGKESDRLNKENASTCTWRRWQSPSIHRPPTELSSYYVISRTKTPMCDSDIDSSHQKPSNKMSNS